MAGVAKSNSSLHLEEFDFNWLVLNKILYLVLFGCIYPHPVKCTTEKLITKKTTFKF